MREGRKGIEETITLACIGLGLIVSVVVSPMDSYFFPNFLYFEGSQLAVLACVLFFRPRLSVLAGTAAVLPAYLALYAVWMSTLPPTEALAWLGYFFSLPGAVVGAVFAVIAVKRRRAMRVLTAVSVATAAVAGGLGLNQLLVCKTVMYCGI